MDTLNEGGNWAKIVKECVKTRFPDLYFTKPAAPVTS